MNSPPKFDSLAHGIMAMGLCFFIGLSFGCTNRSLEGRQTVIKPVPSAALIDTWFGITDFDEAFYELILERSRTGVLTCSFRDGSIKTYKVLDWSSDGYGAVVLLEPDRANGSAQQLQCSVSQNAITVRPVGVGLGLKPIIFRRETNILEQLRRLSGEAKK